MKSSHQSIEPLVNRDRAPFRILTSFRIAAPATSVQVQVEQARPIPQ